MTEYRKKCVILGVTGGIACYKSCYLVSYLKKRGLDVVVIMTKNATEFVSPLTFETLTGNKVYFDTFKRDFDFEVEHISLAKRGDVFVVAPATANFIAKAEGGIADDMLTTTYLAFKKKKIICPAMNTGMFEDEATTRNIENLKKKDVEFLSPVSGLLACGDVGMGKMEEPDVIGEYILNELRQKRDFEGKNILITAGGTVEDIDGVRFLSNYSSGKMGIALAAAASERGALVTFVSGRMSVPSPSFHKNISVKSTDEMLLAVMENYASCDIIIKAAAPCDFKVKNKFENKIKDKSLSIEFSPNPDIAAAVGKVKGARKLVVFAAETENVLENAKGKLDRKNADLIVANDLREEGAGFDSDTNSVTMITRDGSLEKTGVLSKFEIANRILDKIISL